MIATVGTAGFFGNYYIGAAYEWNSSHQIEASLGSYTNNKKSGTQINLAYRFAVWNIAWRNKIWKPASVGFNTIYAMDQEHFFVKSPSKYPSEGYYEQTGLRGSLELGSSMIFLETNLELIYYLRFLDNGLVAFYNNSRRDLQYYTSSGVGLSYHF